MPFVSHPFSETSYQKTLCTVAPLPWHDLTERAGGVFSTPRLKSTSWCPGYTSPLTVFQVFHAIRADQAQHRIQHRDICPGQGRNGPGLPMSYHPDRSSELRIQHVNVISATHCTSYDLILLFSTIERKDADVIRYRLRIFHAYIFDENFKFSAACCFSSEIKVSKN